MDSGTDNRAQGAAWHPLIRSPGTQGSLLSPQPPSPRGCSYKCPSRCPVPSRRECGVGAGQHRHPTSRLTGWKLPPPLAALGSWAPAAAPRSQVLASAGLLPRRTDGPQVPPPQTERVHAKNEFSKVIVTTLAHSSGCHIHVAQANLVYAVIFRVEGLDLLGPQRWSPGPGGRQGRPGLGPPPGKPPPGLNRSVTTPGRGQRFGASFHTL